METVEKSTTYRAIIQQILSEYAIYKPSHGDIEMQAIFDIERDRYQVVGVGWDGDKRIHGCSLHLDIKNEKIWIQLNNTEIDIGQTLVDMGVPREDIVVGFQPPYIRQYSGYAVI